MRESVRNHNRFCTNSWTRASLRHALQGSVYSLHIRLAASALTARAAQIKDTLQWPRRPYLFYTLIKYKRFCKGSYEILYYVLFHSVWRSYHPKIRFAFWEACSLYRYNMLYIRMRCNANSETKLNSNSLT